MPLLVSDVTKSRILSYANFTEQQRVQELDELDILIETNPNNPLLYSARAKIKTQLMLEPNYDMVKRFRLDPEFFDEWCVEHARVKGIQKEALRLSVIAQQENFLAGYAKIEMLTNRAINDDSMSLTAKLQVLCELLGKKQCDHAKKLADHLLKLYPAEHLVLFNAAGVYTQFHKFEKAYEYYLRAYQLNDTSPVYLNHVVGSLLERNQYPEAIAILENGLAKTGNDKLNQEYLTLCYLKTAQIQKADELIQRLKSENNPYQPKFAEITIHLTTAVQKQKEKQLRQEALAGNYLNVKKLLDEGVDVNSFGEETLRTPLHWLCRSEAPLAEKIKVFKLLIDKSGKITSDIDGNTPLHHLIMTNNFVFLSHILNSIAGSNALRMPNKQGYVVHSLLSTKLNLLQKVVDSNKNTPSDSPVILATKTLLQQGQQLSIELQNLMSLDVLAYNMIASNIK